MLKGAAPHALLQCLVSMTCPSCKQSTHWKQTTHCLCFVCLQQSQHTLLTLLHHRAQARQQSALQALLSGWLLSPSSSGMQLLGRQCDMFVSLVLPCCITGCWGGDGLPSPWSPRPSPRGLLYRVPCSNSSSSRPCHARHVRPSLRLPPSAHPGTPATAAVCQRAQLRNPCRQLCFWWRCKSNSSSSGSGGRWGVYSHCRGIGGRAA